MMACGPTLLRACRTRPVFQRLLSSHSRHGGCISARAAATEETTRSELGKNFDPASEEALYKWWESNGYFKPEVNPDGDPFTMSMPPPNVTGRLHMGHAMFVTLQDIMARYTRMRGRSTLWLPGTDHAGIATQMVVERALEGEGVKRGDLGRDAFVDRVWEWKREYGGFITNQLRRLGASCDWSREAFTLDENLSDAVSEAFLRLHQDGLIYRGSYMVNWSTKLQTAVSDLEVEYSDENGSLFFFKYPLADDPSKFLPVATTRPETILGDTAVAVNPNDDRFKDFIGKECEVPMSGGRRIRVIADDYVDIEFGTGALKITPAHDVNDYAIGKRVGLEFINIMNKDGSMNGAAGKYEGLDRFECRKQLWADMEAQGLVIKKEPYTNRVPRSQRGGDIIEPMISDQWFVKMAPLAAPALSAVQEGDITIVPERFEKVYNNWLTDIQDWCISRQLWWGHRIPVYYCFESDAAADAAGGRCDDWVVAGNEADALEKAKAQYSGKTVLRQEEDVLDTWFSSALWPFSTLGWPNETADLAKFYPTQMMETGHDILFFWVARMIMMGMYLTGKVPFDTVFLHGLVRDEKGRKMSKSLGNVLDPLDVIGEYGTDALRYTLATGTTPGQDLNLSMERLTFSRNLTNKLWNASKYVLFGIGEVSDAEFAAFADSDFSGAAAVAELPLAERWIVSRLHEVVDRSTELHDRYDFGEAGRLMYEFFWNDFADWYIEASKARLYSDDPVAKRQTQSVLVYVLERTLRLWHPFLPYISEQLWQAVPHRGDALIAAPWPAAGAATCGAALRQFGLLKEVVGAVRNARAEYSVEISRKVSAVLVVRDAAQREALAGELQSVCLLAKIDPAAVQVVESAQEVDAGEGAVELVVQDGVQVILPLAGLFDAKKELARLEKQRGKLEKELAGLSGRLSNPKFAESAPEKVVKQAQEQAKELEDKIALIAGKITQAQAML